jgi:hypothetical protein
MTLLFKCLDFNKKGELISSEGHVKATEVTGLGTAGLFFNIPGDAAIPADQFCEIVKYFLTNYDLVKNDPRPGLVEFVRSLKTVKGWAEGRSRLEPEEKK